LRLQESVQILHIACLLHPQKKCEIKRNAQYNAAIRVMSHGDRKPPSPQAMYEVLNEWAMGGNGHQWGTVSQRAELVEGAFKTDRGGVPYGGGPSRGVRDRHRHNHLSPSTRQNPPPRMALHQVRISPHREDYGELFAPKGGEGRQDRADKTQRQRPPAARPSRGLGSCVRSKFEQFGYIHMTGQRRGGQGTSAPCCWLEKLGPGPPPHTGGEGSRGPRGMNCGQALICPPPRQAEGGLCLKLGPTAPPPQCRTHRPLKSPGCMVGHVPTRVE